MAEVLLYSWHIVDVSVSEVDMVLTGKDVPRASVRLPFPDSSRKRRCRPHPCLYPRGMAKGKICPVLLGSLSPAGGPGLWDKWETLRAHHAPFKVRILPPTL